MIFHVMTRIRISTKVFSECLVDYPVPIGIKRMIKSGRKNEEDDNA